MVLTRGLLYPSLAFSVMASNHTVNRHQVRSGQVSLEFIRLLECVPMTSTAESPIAQGQ